jgi:tetratricopeptide (TPR) repeat protein
LEAAAIPHWFTKDILAKLLNVHDDQAAAYFEQLQRLPMVEPFPARDAWNVHEATRLALRSELAATQLTKLRKLSTLAVPCFKGDEPHQRIERLYHELVSDPSQAGSALSALRQEWEDKEELLALGPLLLELGNEGLLDDEIEFQSELARFYGALGDAARSFGQSQQALAYFEHAKGTFERLAQVEPSRPVLQRDLSVSYERLGDLARALGQIEPAQSCFEKSLATAERLAHAGPNRADLQRDLSISHERLGDLSRALGQNEAAQAYFQKSLAVRERLARAEPNRADLQRDLFVSYCKLNDLPRALAILEALKKDDRLLPTDESWLAELRELVQKAQSSSA